MGHGEFRTVHHSSKYSHKPYTVQHRVGAHPNYKPVQTRVNPHKDRYPCEFPWKFVSTHSGLVPAFTGMYLRGCGYGSEFGYPREYPCHCLVGC